MRTALIPGSFDPITKGHVDVIGRAATLFDRCIVAVSRNEGKHALFAMEERLALIREALAPWENVAVEVNEGLTVHFAAQHEAVAIVKGLRSAADCNYELPMAQMNRHLAPDIDTVLIPARPEHAHISSSLIKEAARFGGDVSALVPACVAAALERRFATASQ